LSQAKPSAARSSELQVGGAFVADYPDYTRHKFYGYGFYADLDFGAHFGVEAEFHQANDRTVNPNTNKVVPQYQRTVEGGLRYHRTYGRLQPYAKAMYGYGVMEYPPYPLPADPTVSAATIGYNFFGLGTGLDYAVSTHISIRTDFEYQIWFPSSNPLLPIDSLVGKGGLPNGLTPILYTGGIAWRFGSGNYIPSGSSGRIR
jgi:opacity protein-like surface antigen